MERKSIGQFIAALRKANGLTQQQIADRLNVSNKAVSRWERDECAPDLSLIPAIAEMFNVTCDELLKGERIAVDTPTEKSEPKVDKQIKALVNRSASHFKSFIWISLALSVVGLVCMLGISYGFYRPVIGFAVMLLFESAAFVTAVISVNKMKEIKTDNELFEKADISLIEKYNDTLASYSYTAFFASFAGIPLALPLLLTVSNYVESVLSFKSYFPYFIGIALTLAIVFLKYINPYTAWLTGEASASIEPSPAARKIRAMNLLQMGMVLLAGALFIIAPYFSQPHDGFSGFDIVILSGLVCLAAVIVTFIIFMVRQKDERKKFLLPGIRNILLIPSAFIIEKMHDCSWEYYGPAEGYDVSLLEKYDVWQTEYFWYALQWVFLAFIVFALIDIVLQRMFSLLNEELE